MPAGPKWLDLTASVSQLVQNCCCRPASKPNDDGAVRARFLPHWQPAREPEFDDAVK